ncbi:hypothetical protein ACWNX4_00575 [Candidatus Vidania fulgoroideorum]
MNQILFFDNYKYSKEFIPFSKSVLIRVLFILSFTKGNIRIPSRLVNIDIQVMINSLSLIGKTITYSNKFIYIEGNKRINVISDSLNFKNSGITSRIITFLLLLKTNKRVLLDGDKQMRMRPLDGLFKIYSLLTLENKVDFLGKKLYFPICINKKPKLLPTSSIKYSNLVSSQFLTSIIINLPIFCKRKLLIELNRSVSLSYVEMTIKIMKQFGININIDGNNITYKSSHYKFNINPYSLIEKDFSSFSYMLFIYLYKGKSLKIKSKKYFALQSENKLVNLFSLIGFKLKKLNSNSWINFNMGPYFKVVSVDCYDIIDTSLSIPNLLFKGLKQIKLYNIRNWNFKESKRLDLLKCELKKLGFLTKCGKNWIKIINTKTRDNVVISTYYDHRVFMGFFPICMGRNNLVLNYPNNVKKTFPLFLKRYIKNKNYDNKIKNN